jgi:CelD/BcsL family acetyltransferase involved in cellulose biosynthesis
MIETQAIRDHEALYELGKEWSTLHRAARPGSPFEHPAWASTWAQFFVPPGKLECIAVRDPDRDGELIGFAPLYRRHRGPKHVGATCIQPLGTGRLDGLTEVVQVLSLPERSRDVARAAVGHLEQLPDWNWLQLSLSPDQGWLLPQWLEQRATSSVLHRGVRACVIVRPLPGSPEELLKGLKRNVRESVRRGKNRAQRVGGIRMRRAEEVEDVTRALDDVVTLHRKRSQMQGKVAHADVVADASKRSFLVDAVRKLAIEGLARVHLAEHEDRPVAGLLVLSDGDTDYVSLTGLDPDYWNLSLNTLLIYEALVEAIRLGRSAVNLSTGPDVAKLRWSQSIITYNDFTIVPSGRRSRLLYGAFSHLSLSLSHRQEHQRHRLVPGVKSTPSGGQ